MKFLKGGLAERHAVHAGYVGHWQVGTAVPAGARWALARCFLNVKAYANCAGDTIYETKNVYGWGCTSDCCLYRQDEILT